MKPLSRSLRTIVLLWLAWAIGLLAVWTRGVGVALALPLAWAGVSGLRAASAAATGPA